MNTQQISATIRSHGTSAKVYLGLLAIMVILAGLMMSLAINQGQRPSWITVLIVALLGWIGLILTPKAGFPEMWEARLSNEQRLWIPALMGIGLGALMVLFDLVQPKGAEAQTPFPDSLIVFSFAGLIEEIVVHLFLTTFLIWIISGLVFDGRYQATVFWIVATGGALLYWLLQLSTILAYFPERFSIGLTLQVFCVIMVTIMVGAYLFRRAGFLAALSLRYGFYLVWHIVWGGGVGVVRYFLA